MRHVEKDIMLRVLDQQWRDHLGAMDYLRQGIHLRGYAQKDYRFEYKREAFELFAAMLERIKFDTVTILATLDVQVKSPRADRARRRSSAAQRLNRAAAGAARRSRIAVAARSRPAKPPQAARPAGVRASRRRTMPRPQASSRSSPCAPRRRSAATSPARAAAARSSRTATACSKASSKKHEAAAARGRRGAVRCRSGRVLIAERPAGKHMAGWWEFPGGKVADGESDADALVRELREELGIEARPDARTHDAHARVSRSHRRSRVVARAITAASRAGSMDSS